MHIQLYCNNTSFILTKFWGKEKYLYVLAIDIWNWCISHNIHLSAAHAEVFFNVKADELLRWLNANLKIGFRHGNFSANCA